MEDLDKYFDDQDLDFNHALQDLYLEFTGAAKPNTLTPFESFAEGFHTIYFFLLENYSSPFACVNKVEDVFESLGFGKEDKLIMLDNLLSLLFTIEEEHLLLIYIQLVDLRNSMSPFEEDEEVLNPGWAFDVDSIKNEFYRINVPSEREKFIIDLALKLKIKKHEISEIEYEYYLQTGFIDWIQAEFARAKYDQANPTNLNESKLRMRQIALKYVYERGSITRDNSNSIAKEYGYTSGEKLYQLFTEYSGRANRTGRPTNPTRTTLLNKIKLFESVLDLLSEDSKGRAEDEIKVLKTYLEEIEF